MSRLNVLSLLFLLFFISCQSEGPPKEVPEPEPIQTALAFEKLQGAGEDGHWVSQSVLDKPISGTKIMAKDGKDELLLIAGEHPSFSTSFSHNDIELELEFMLSSGAEASLQFQGKYPILIADSWNGKQVNGKTVGAIGGNSPTINAALAPGLWQHLRILFHAQDSESETGPVFEKVILNGMLIQEGLTIEASEANTPSGPLSFQAKQGAIAFRNISYKLYGDELPRLQDLNYKYYKLTSKTTAPDFIPDFSTMEAEESGRTDSLTKNVTEDRKDFGLTFEGKFIAPAEGEYMFEARVQGGSILIIDGKEVVNHDGETNYEEGSAFGKVSLTQGAHDFTYLYRKEHMQWRQGLGLFVEGPGVEKMALHSKGSVNPARKHTPYELEAESGISLHRSYLMHKGKKLTHAISVGNTNGVHYSYDLDNASLLQMWGGKFLDVRQMWVGRGAEQLAVPMGPSIIHSARPNIAILKSKNALWPKSIDEQEAIQYKGYDIASNGAPIFRYKIGESEITDHISTEASSRHINRKLSLEGQAKSAYVLLAKGKEIHEGASGVYGVDASNYYLEVNDSAEKPFIRNTAYGQELLLPLSPNSSISYTLTW